MAPADLPEEPPPAIPEDLAGLPGEVAAGLPGEERSDDFAEVELREGLAFERPRVVSDEAVVEGVCAPRSVPDAFDRLIFARELEEVFDPPERLAVDFFAADREALLEEPVFFAADFFAAPREDDFFADDFFAAPREEAFFDDDFFAPPEDPRPRAEAPLPERFFAPPERLVLPLPDDFPADFFFLATLCSSCPGSPRRFESYNLRRGESRRRARPDHSSSFRASHRNRPSRAAPSR